jgi:hypothetical protein
MLRRVTLCALAAACGLGLSTGPVRADNEKGTAVIKGRVIFEGTPPGTKQLPPMNADAVCQKHHAAKPVPDQGTIVYTKDGNAIPYVFVYVKNGIKGKYTPPGEPVVIDQKGCQYRPHVVGMVAGQQIDIKNSDPTNHNIHSLAEKNNKFNFAQPNANMVRSLTGRDTFTRPEIMVKIKCDVHAWMSTFVGVCPHPFFDVSKSHDDHSASGDLRGSYEIKNLPAGDYEIEAVHETFGRVTQKVSVKDGETRELIIKMGPNVKKADASGSSREVILSPSEGELAVLKN